MTALALAPDTRTGYEPAGGVDRAIRVSTAIAVLAVAGVAAYVSYWHAYAVVCAHGETGVTARLEPATIDGLVYASSMVNLYAARHRLPVPALARWLLALGIVATLAANMAQGWSHGPVGAVIAAWPRSAWLAAMSCWSGSSGPRRQVTWSAGQPRTTAGRRRATTAPAFASLLLRGLMPGRARLIGQDAVLTPGGGHGPVPAPGMAGAGQASGPGRITADQADQMADQAPGLTRAGDGRQPGRRHQRRRGGRLPRQPPGGQAAVRAQAGRAVRQDLQTLGTQPDGRSPAEPGTGLAPAGTATQGAGTPPADDSGGDSRPMPRPAALA